MRMQPFIIALSVLFAMLFSQAPEFTQQYLQRLAGTVEELSNIVRNFDEDSLRSGYDRSAALGVMRNNPERLVRDQATRMKYEGCRAVGPFQRVYRQHRWSFSPKDVAKLCTGATFLI
jgi:hypothetical protein